MTAAAISQGARRFLIVTALFLGLGPGFRSAGGAFAAQPPAPVKKAAAAQPFAKGPIEKLDPTHRLLTLKTEDGSRTFVLTPGTFLYQGKEKISADQLSTGELVAVRFVVSPAGSNLVVRLKAYPAPVPAAAVPPKETP